MRVQEQFKCYILRTALEQLFKNRELNHSDTGITYRLVYSQQDCLYWDSGISQILSGTYSSIKSMKPTI